MGHPRAAQLAARDIVPPDGRLGRHWTWMQHHLADTPTPNGTHAPTTGTCGAPGGRPQARRTVRTSGTVRIWGHKHEPLRERRLLADLGLPEGCPLWTAQRPVVLQRKRRGAQPTCAHTGPFEWAIREVRIWSWLGNGWSCTLLRMRRSPFHLA
jgi:hypothetical protein